MSSQSKRTTPAGYSSKKADSVKTVVEKAKEEANHSGPPSVLGLAAQSPGRRPQ